MTIKELEDFLVAHQNIEYRIEEDSGDYQFRNINLEWYNEKEERATKITKEALEKLDENTLMNQINKGLDVDGITRITGYFGKVKSFNPGKIAELKDRHREV